MCLGNTVSVVYMDYKPAHSVTQGDPYDCYIPSLAEVRLEETWTRGHFERS